MNGGERHWSRAAVMLAALLAFVPWAGAKERIGTTVFARGAVTASLESDIRLIGHGTPIYERDVLTAGEDSFAILELNDGTKMTLRPNTVFRVDQYDDAEDAESVRFNLFRGGLRTVTGSLARRAPDAFELRTPVATVGIRGTDFSARLCERDCTEETEALGDDAGGGPDVIGRVAFVKGEASAVSLFDKRRSLSAGGPVFQGDTLETGSGGLRGHRISRREPDYVTGEYAVSNQPARVRRGDARTQQCLDASASGRDTNCGRIHLQGPARGLRGRHSGGDDQHPRDPVRCRVHRRLCAGWTFVDHPVHAE